MIDIFSTILIIMIIEQNFYQAILFFFFKKIRAHCMFLNLLFIKCPIYLDFHKFVSRIENFNCFADLII